MSKFKVGDKVISTASKRQYSITYAGWTGTVVALLDHPDEDILVKANINNISDYDEFYLNSKYFELLVPQSRYKRNIPDWF